MMITPLTMPGLIIEPGGKNSVNMEAIVFIMGSKITKLKIVLFVKNFSLTIWDVNVLISNIADFELFSLLNYWNSRS